MANKTSAQPWVAVLLGDNADARVVALSTIGFRQVGIRVQVVGVSQTTNKATIQVRQEVKIGIDMTMQEALAAKDTIRYVVIPFSSKKVPADALQIVQAVPNATFIAFGNTIKALQLAQVEKIPFLSLKWEGFFQDLAKKLAAETFKRRR